MFVIEWDAPSANNSPITQYKVYLSSKQVKINHIQEEDSKDQTPEQQAKHDLKQVATIEISQNQRYHEFFDLEPSTCYYVVVTAVNKLGEGYQNKPVMVRTMPIDINSQAGTLYVWGSNINSEIGLTDDQVVQNVSFFQKSSMKKAIRQTCFKNNSVAQVAAGNTSSVVLVVDQENQEQSIVFQGLATITKDEESKQIYFS